MRAQWRTLILKIQNDPSKIKQIQKSSRNMNFQMNNRFSQPTFSLSTNSKEHLRINKVVPSAKIEKPQPIKQSTSQGYSSMNSLSLIDSSNCDVNDSNREQQELSQKQQIFNAFDYNKEIISKEVEKHKNQLTFNSNSQSGSHKILYTQTQLENQVIKLQDLSNIRSTTQFPPEAINQQKIHSKTILHRINQSKIIKFSRLVLKKNLFSVNVYNSLNSLDDQFSKQNLANKSHKILTQPSENSRNQFQQLNTERESRDFQTIGVGQSLQQQLSLHNQLQCQLGVNQSTQIKYPNNNKYNLKLRFDQTPQVPPSQKPINFNLSQINDEMRVNEENVQKPKIFEKSPIRDFLTPTSANQKICFEDRSESFQQILNKRSSENDKRSSENGISYQSAISNEEKKILEILSNPTLINIFEDQQNKQKKNKIFDFRSDFNLKRSFDKPKKQNYSIQNL